MTESLKSQYHRRDYIPLIIIFSGIILFTILMQIFKGGSDIDFAMRMFMGAFFFVFGGFKILNLNTFAEAYRMYDLLAMRSKGYSYLYPFLELGLAILYFADIGGVFRDIFTLMLMLISAAGVIIKLRRRERIPCACLGMVFILPMTWVTLAEDLLMALEALFMILMALAFQFLSISHIREILELHLRIHDTAHWVTYSQWGHWVVGGVMMVFVFSSLIERNSISQAGWPGMILRYIVPWLLIIMAFNATVVDMIYHYLIDDPQAVGRLMVTPSSQLFQHLIGFVLLGIAGIAELLKVKCKEWIWLPYVTPGVVLLAGIGFFFHQQLGALDSVVSAMIWHMSFGGLLVVGATMRIVDILLFEERNSFFILWVMCLLTAFVMMSFYREPVGAYEVPGPQEELEFQYRLDQLKKQWSLYP